MSGEKTPGQVGYETFQAARWPNDPGVAWMHPAVATARPAWDAVAQAVVAHAGVDQVAEITRLRGLLDAYVPLWEYYGAPAAPAGDAPKANKSIDESGAVREQLAARTALLATVLDKFTIGSDGYRARISQVTYIRLRRDAGWEITEAERKMIGA